MYHALCEVLGSLPEDTVCKFQSLQLSFIVNLQLLSVASLLRPWVYCEQPALCPARGAGEHCYQRENHMGNGRIHTYSGNREKWHFLWALVSIYAYGFQTQKWNKHHTHTRVAIKYGPWYYMAPPSFLLVGQEGEGPAYHSLHHWPGNDLQSVHESQVSLKLWLEYMPVCLKWTELMLTFELVCMIEVINTGSSIASSSGEGNQTCTITLILFSRTVHFRLGKSTSGVGNPCAPHPLNESLESYMC